jgi:hypothetical protein
MAPRCGLNKGDTMRISIAALVCAALSPLLNAQPADPSPAFEVVSVKPT